MIQSPIQELAIFILDKFRNPNTDMRYLGGSSNHMHLMRDAMKTLNSLSKTKDKTEKIKTLNQLRGQVLTLNAVQYFSDQEVEEILIKIDLAEEK
ncbi:MAG: hypothetical protein M3Q14_02805 [bacterium]|nr:hypothetical protein [bacterium]